MPKYSEKKEKKMKNKSLIIAAAVIIAIIGIIFIAKPFSAKKAAKKAAPQAAAVKGKMPQVMPAAPTSVKKTFSKGMGGMTVRMMNVKNKEMPVRLKVFRSDNGKSSIYIGSAMASRMQELAPGTYDIEIDTVPQMIYKKINISANKETVEEIGAMTGAVNVKAISPSKKDAAYSVRVNYPGTDIAVIAGITNRPIEVLAGKYDLVIGTLPQQVRKNVNIEKGKEKILDLGLSTGTLTVKAEDENKKEVRYTAKIKKSEKDEPVTSITTNKPAELLAGTYNIELLAKPAQVKKDIKVNAGEEVMVEFSVQTPPAPVKPAPAPVKPAAAKVPAKSK
jgi:hypothetical protein